MFLSSSLTVTEVYDLCLFCFHIRRNKKIELENMYFVAVAVWNYFSGKILKPVNIDIKFRTCMISAQKSMSCTEQNLNKYSLNKWRQSPYIFLTNYISVINDVINIHRECLEYRQAPCFQTFRLIYLLINHEYTNYHFHLRQWFFPWKKENVFFLKNSTILCFHKCFSELVMWVHTYLILKCNCNGLIWNSK